jgi:hypothetical protein
MESETKTLPKGQRGTANVAVNPETATDEYRSKVKRDAESRNSPKSHKEEAGPKHSFKLSFEGIEKTIVVNHRHDEQAMLEARAVFGDIIHAATKKRPNPREVKCEKIAA